MFSFWGMFFLLICLVENTVGCSISVLKFCCCEKCGWEMWVNSIYSIRIQFLGGWQQQLETPAAIQGNAGNKARDDLFKKFRKMHKNDDKLSIQKIAAMGSKPCDVARGPLSSFEGAIWGAEWVPCMCDPGARPCAFKKAVECTMMNMCI